MTRDKFIAGASQILYTNLLSNSIDVISDMDELIERIRGTIKDEELGDMQVAQVLADGFNIIKHIFAESSLLRKLAKEISKLPNGYLSEDVKYEPQDIIDEEEFKDVFGDKINMSDIKIPSVTTFEPLRETVFELLSEAVSFVILLVSGDMMTNSKMSSEEIINSINEKIEKYVSTYDEIGLLLLTKSKSGERKELRLSFEDNDKEISDNKEDEDTPQYLN